MNADIQRKTGFTLIEILLVAATVLLIVIVMIPALTRMTDRQKRSACVNNLKQIGLAARIWGSTGTDDFPWVSSGPEGSRAFADTPQVFRHFVVMSNQLTTPKVLACPQDSTRKSATTFANFSNSNLSYFVALDSDETKPERLLSGDRNITGGVFTNGFLRLLKTNSLAGWTKEIHTHGGNIGLSDGSAQQTTAQQLQQQLQMNTLETIRLAIP